MLRIRHRFRRLILVVALLGGIATWLVVNPASYEEIVSKIEDFGADFGINQAADAISTNISSLIAIPTTQANPDAPLATAVLDELEVKGRSPKTGYAREEFYSSWPTVDGCNLRQRIIKRELGDSAKLDGCTVLSGEYDEPYTGEHKIYSEKTEISNKIQIDHIVALSDAWQKGADLDHMSKEDRYALATDPLNLIAVDASANQSKSDGDAATWLPANKRFRCQYVARQVSVKYKYHLWVTDVEKNAIAKILENCPNEPAIGVSL